MSKFISTKVIPLGSCAFRQPYATSHCKFIHGYRLQAKFWFSCDKLDQNNWVVDFGSLKPLKAQLEEIFDHKTVVWSKDPQIDIFKLLEAQGMVELVTLDDGVGIERFAELCHKIANQHVKDLTNGRCWCSKVEVWEHEGNSAIYKDKLQTEWKS
jgi:6-pyruvoyltetrahydropterin/6-carboxytetrahydropterin synthase